MFGEITASGDALAQAAVALDPATDGTIVLVGTGWWPGQPLVVNR
jgi:hypothetical protein